MKIMACCKCWVRRSTKSDPGWKVNGLRISLRGPFLNLMTIWLPKTCRSGPECPTDRLTDTPTAQVLAGQKKCGGISSSARRRIWLRVPEHWPAESMDCARTVCEWEDLKSKAMKWRNITMVSVFVRGKSNWRHSDPSNMHASSSLRLVGHQSATLITKQVTKITTQKKQMR